MLAQSGFLIVVLSHLRENVQKQMYVVSVSRIEFRQNVHEKSGLEVQGFLHGLFSLCENMMVKNMFQAAGFFPDSLRSFFPPGLENKESCVMLISLSRR